MVFLALGIFLTVSLVLSVPFYRRIFFNPLVVFFAIWFFDFFFYELDRKYQLFYVRLSLRADFLFIVGFLCFFLGAITVALLQARRRHSHLKPLQTSVFHIHSLYKITILLIPFFLLAVAYKYVLAFARYGNPFAHLELVRQETVSGLFGYPVFLYLFTFFEYLIIANLGILLVFLKHKKRIVFLTLLSIATAFLNDATVGGRGGTLVIGVLLVCSVMAAYVMKGKKLTLKHYVAGVTAIVLVVLLLTVILYLRGGASVGFFVRFFRDSYIYLVGTIPAFSVYIEQTWYSRLPLQHTFGGFYQLADTVLKNAFGVSITKPEDFATTYAPITLGPFNSSGHLFYYYIDYGELGIVFFSYALGALASILFFRALYYRRVIDIQFLALAMVYLVMSIRGVMTAGPSFWATIFLVILQYGVLLYYRSVLAPFPKSLSEKGDRITEPPFPQ